MDNSLSINHSFVMYFNCWLKKRICPRVPAKRRWRIMDPSMTLPLTTGFPMDTRFLSVSRFEGGRRLQTEKGLKIHQAKLNAKGGEKEL